MSARILQISDIHLFADSSKELLGVNTHDSFQAVYDKIQQEENAAQLILLSGDLSQDNSEASYLRLADILKSMQVPAYYIPGNHDDPKLMSQIFPRNNILNDKHIFLENWQIILLNSQKPGAVEGLLDASQLAFLQDCLQKFPQHHALIAFHHHPFHVGCEWLDNLCLTNAAEFWQLVSHHPNVRSVLCGHVHQEHNKVIQNISCYSAPSTCFQFKRNQNHFGLEKLAPGYRWLDLYPNGKVDSGVARVAEYVGTFDENAKGY